MKTYYETRTRKYSDGTIEQEIRMIKRLEKGNEPMKKVTVTMSLDELKKHDYIGMQTENERHMLYQHGNKFTFMSAEGIMGWHDSLEEAFEDRMGDKTFFVFETAKELFKWMSE